jgi:hypothetical protein
MNYRFAKSIDTSSFEAPCACTNQSFPVDQRQERGPSDFDVRHAFTASAIWDIPLFRGNDWKSKILGRWQVSGIATYNTGFPWTPKAFGCLAGATSSSSNFCDPRPTFYTGQQPRSNSNENFLSAGGLFPGAFIGGDCNNAPGCNRYFNTVIPFNAAPFSQPPGIGRNVFRGPKYFSLDMTFAKKFGLANLGFLGENANVDLRFNFFNILNNLNLAPFNSNSDPTRVALPQFSQAVSALSGRVGEFQIRFSF